MVYVYLNFVRILRREYGLPNPLSDNGLLWSIWKGIKSFFEVSSRSSLCIEVIHFLAYTLLSSSIEANISFSRPLAWPFVLVSSGSLKPNSHATFNPMKQFLQSDFSKCPYCILLQICWNRTIHFRQWLFQYGCGVIAIFVEANWIIIWFSIWLVSAIEKIKF